jgi:hypothetical protein
MSKLVPVEIIAGKILEVRGKKVMLDRDLAVLYGVPTKRLNEQVRRNIKRFPEDFMIQLTWEELNSLRSQFATLKNQPIGIITSKRGKHIKYLPYAFTEQGVAMLSSVLNSERAIKVNIQIMRAFVQLRGLLLTHKELAKRLEALEMRFGEHDNKIKVIFEAIRQLLDPVKEDPKPKIGFRSNR